MRTVDQGSLGKGFADPVMGAQRCFRGILAAMSEPGTVHRLREPVDAPLGVAPAAAQALLTLADQETPVWLSPGLVGTASRYVRFHCGAPIVNDAAGASFALIEGGVSTPGLGAFNSGDERYPDRSATVIVQCVALDGGPRVALSGPGIRGSCEVSPAGLHAEFWQDAAANNARYPLGVDLILVSGDAIVCVPRSTRIGSLAGAC